MPDAMTATAPDLIERRTGNVLTLVMNRPERRNALTMTMLSGLLSALERAAADPEVACVVLTGAGGAFCAGGDVKGMAEAGAAGTLPSLTDRQRGLRGAMETSRLLHTMPKPTVAVIPGAAAGAGLSLALACDFRIAAEEAKLTVAFPKVGLSGDFGGSWFVTQLVGSAKARELYYLSPVLSGAEAARLGLVTRAVPAAELEATATSFVGELAGAARLAVGYMKKNINLAEGGGSLEAALDQEALHHCLCETTHDHREGAMAFAEKRAPTFQGR